MSDHEARRLLDTYKEAALEDLGGGEVPQRTGFVRLEPELTLLPGAQPWLRLRISDGGRQYVVKSIPDLLRTSNTAAASVTERRWPLCTGGMPLMRSPAPFCSCCAVR